MTMMLRPLLRIIKDEMPGFCHSVSCLEMAAEIQANLAKLPPGEKKSVNTDGSNHDGHQHWLIILVVDVFFFRALIKRGWVEKALANYTYGLR